MDRPIQQLNEYNPENIVFPVYAQVKLDGIFGRWDCIDKCFYTRDGNRIKGLSVLEAELSEIEGCDLDGELVIPDLDFFTMNGKIRSGEETPDCMYYVFDTVPHGKAYDYELRVYSYMSLTQTTHVHPVKIHVIRSLEEADAFYEKVLARGYEGVVYKSPAAFYTDGKHDHAVKRVPIKSCECTVLSAYEGKGKLSGMLGGFVVDFQGVPVKVGGGPGIDYAKRKEMWENQHRYIGKLMKCTYKSLTPGGSMRSPQMLGLRWDI